MESLEALEEVSPRGRFSVNADSASSVCASIVSPKRSVSSVLPGVPHSVMGTKETFGSFGFFLRSKVQLPTPPLPDHSRRSSNGHRLANFFTSLRGGMASFGTPSWVDPISDEVDRLDTCRDRVRAWLALCRLGTGDALLETAMVQAVLRLGVWRGGMLTLISRRSAKTELGDIVS